MKVAVRSFDVFDTSLTRLVGHPASLFFLHGHCLARAGAWSHGVARFAAARVEAERQARCNTRSQEVTIADIYRQLAHACDLTAEQADAYLQAELQLEEALLRPVRQTQALLADHRRDGGRVLFISDTYFPAGLLRRWLERAGMADESDRVWASSDTGVTKASGDLFRRVLQEERIEPALLLHRGDGAIADVAMPAALGIRSEWFEAGLLTHHERLMEQHTQRTDGVASLYAGASRHIRLSVVAEDEPRRALRDLAAQVGGPVVSAFVSWVLMKSQTLGVRRLLFVARDGQVMLRMAGPLADKLGLEFDMRYLYAGRQVVNLAGLTALDAKALSWITESAAIVTLADILQRVDVPLADVADDARRAGLPMAGPIGWGNLEPLTDFLQQPTVVARILESARRSRANLQIYFSASGLMDGTPCAVVDVGWKGRVFNSICAVIGDVHASRHTALYFGLYAKPDPLPAGRQAAYMFDLSATAPIGAGHDIPKLAQVMEIFCQATHGQVLAVANAEGCFVPVLRSARNDVGPDWDVAFFQDCLVAFAQAIAFDARWCIPMPDLRPMCEQLLRQLMTRPDAGEARILGGFRYNDDQNGSAAEPFATPYRYSDLRAAFREGSLPQKSFVWWEQGALAMTEPGVQTAWRVVRKISRIRSTPVWRLLSRCRRAIAKFAAQMGPSRE